MKIKNSELLELPNIGQRSVNHLHRVGIKSIAQLQKLGAEKVYEKMCRKQKMHVHMAFLYVLRAALFWSYNRDRREEALRWWMFRSPSDHLLVLKYKKLFAKNK